MTNLETDCVNLYRLRSMHVHAVNRVCKYNVSNDEISRHLAIIAHYGEPAIVNSAQRFRQDAVEHLLLVKLYQQ